MRKNYMLYVRSMAATVVAVSVSACSQRYMSGGVTLSRILVDSVYDARPDGRAAVLMRPYVHTVDSIMSPVVGHTAFAMKGGQPESALSNLLSDILVWSGAHYGERPVLGVYNMGGIRASLPAGKVTYGDVLEVAPFENKVCFLTLSGESLMQLFREMAASGGQGVSRGAEIVISRDGRLLRARLHGKEIDPAADYRIATINYLAEGNDKLTAFRSCRDLNSPQAKENDTRFIISDYFVAMEQQGKVVSAAVEGRTTVE